MEGHVEGLMGGGDHTRDRYCKSDGTRTSLSVESRGIGIGAGFAVKYRVFHND